MGNAYDYAFYLDRPDIREKINKNKEIIEKAISKIVEHYRENWMGDDYGRTNGSTT